MFDDKFEVILADTPEARRIHHQLRYEVYVRETGYEKDQQNADFIEKDQFDDNSVHFLVRTKASGAWIAAMRLVLGEYSELPVYQRCDIKPQILKSIGTAMMGEISRLCVIGSYRRRSGGRSQPEGSTGSEMSSQAINLDERRREPEIMMGLIRAAFAFSRARGIDHWFFLVAPSLARILNSVALRITDAGPVCDFHGERKPYVCDLRTLLLDLPGKSPSTLKMFQQECAFRRYSQIGEEEMGVAVLSG